MAIEISLAPNGNILLHLPRHEAQVPMNLAGLALLKHVLQGQASGATKIGEQGNPTQWNLDQWLKSPVGQAALAKAQAEKRSAPAKPSVPISLDMDLADLL